VIVVSNSSPLIVLTKIGHLDLLPKLYGEITITPEVFEELTRSGQHLPAAVEISTASWIKVRPAMSGTDRLTPLRTGLGIGETSAIELAKELRADLVLLDDRKARRTAQEEGLNVLGTVGVLEDAFGLKLLDDLATAYRKLLAAGAYINLEILQDSLKSHDLPEL